MNIQEHGRFSSTYSCHKFAKMSQSLNLSKSLDRGTILPSIDLHRECMSWNDVRSEIPWQSPILTDKQWPRWSSRDYDHHHVSKSSQHSNYSTFHGHDERRTASTSRHKRPLLLPNCSPESFHHFQLPLHSRTTTELQTWLTPIHYFHAKEHFEEPVLAQTSHELHLKEKTLSTICQGQRI